MNFPGRFDFHIANGGLGNRIAAILRGILDGVPVAWENRTTHGLGWSDFFETDVPCEIVYFPNERKLRKKYSVDSGNWAFPLEDIPRVVEELRTWRPSAQVREKMLDMPTETIGYKVRLLAYDRQSIESFLVPCGCFLACDCKQFILCNSDRCIANIDAGMAHDFDRSPKHWLYAVADWFMLMQCRYIVEVNPSTFTSAHKICGIPFTSVINQEKLEKVLCLGTDICKLHAIKTPIHVKLDTFTWAQEFWGELRRDFQTAGKSYPLPQRVKSYLLKPSTDQKVICVG